MRVLVWGAGAIGGTVAAYAIRAGHDVGLVDANAAHVDAIRQEGLRIEGPIDSFTVPAPAFGPDEVRGRWQKVLLCVKAHHTEAALDRLVPHLADDGWVASLQNGLNERAISRHVGADRTVGAFINFSADVLEPGRIHFGGRGAFVIGELDGRPSERTQELLEFVRPFDPEAVVSDNVWGYLWGKMGYGIMLFASALTNASIVEALASPEAQPVHAALAGEILAAARADGARPMGFNGFDPDAFGPDGTPEARAASFDAMVAFNRRSAKTHTGVWRDLAVHKRKTEVDAQYGPVLDIAEQHGVPMPLTERLVEIMHEIENGARPLAWPNLLELALLPDGGGGSGRSRGPRRQGDPS